MIRCNAVQTAVSPPCRRALTDYLALLCASDATSQPPRQVPKTRSFIPYPAITPCARATGKIYCLGPSCCYIYIGKQGWRDPDFLPMHYANRPLAAPPCPFCHRQAPRRAPSSHGSMLLPLLTVKGSWGQLYSLYCTEAARTSHATSGDDALLTLELPSCWIFCPIPSFAQFDLIRPIRSFARPTLLGYLQRPAQSTPGG